MNKLGIWAIAIAATFIIGASFSSVLFNSQAEAKPPDLVAEAIDRLTAVITNTATQGPQGEQGEQGDQGEQGEQGETAEVNTGWLFVDNPFGQTETALCGPGLKILAGGIQVVVGSGNILQSYPVFRQGPNSDQEGWTGTVQSPANVRVWASCLIP